MAKRRTDRKRRDPARRHFAAIVMMLLPGFMFLGVLAPKAVTVKPVAREEIGPSSFRNFVRRPVRVPHALVNALQPGLVVLDPVFSSARYLADQAKRVFDPNANEPKSENKDIVLSEEETPTSSFPSSIDVAAEPTTVLAVDLKPLWTSADFDIIPPNLDRNGYQQYDDFHGAGLRAGVPVTTPKLVPEPATGALVALGLVALALRRKRA